ncbi:MAG: stalk domain-containing protein [Defluviitaleaceae bacterium]|nr:stalk domain-containing protein [Defluviitaleaceae bacterium]MCL2263671.1 stalk domain-containing protein [Defluviitaleaceae bacterium]
MKKTQAIPVNAMGYAIMLGVALCLLTIPVRANFSNDEPSTLVLTIGSTTIVVNGEEQHTDVAAFIADGRTMIPVRLVSEALGANVHWDAESPTVVTIGTASPYAPFPFFSIFVEEALPNNMGMPILQNGRTFVPLRYVAERMGVDVDWNPETQTITLTGNNTSSVQAATSQPPALPVAITHTETEARAFEQEVFEIFTALRPSQPVEWCDILANAARWRSRNVEFYYQYGLYHSGNGATYFTARISDYPTPEQFANRANNSITQSIGGSESLFPELISVGYDTVRGRITIAISWSQTSSAMNIIAHGALSPDWLINSPYGYEFIKTRGSFHPPTLLAVGYSFEEVSEMFEREMARVVNLVREEYGLNPVVWDDSLGRAARIHSLDVNADGHTGSDGSSPRNRAAREGWQGVVVENVGGAGIHPTTAIGAWMGSPPHRANILDPAHTHLGTGYGLPGRQLDFAGHIVLKLGFR